MALWVIPSADEIFSSVQLFLLSAWLQHRGRKNWIRERALGVGFMSQGRIASFPVLLPVLFHVLFHEQMVASSFKESSSEKLVCIHVGIQGKGSAWCWSPANAPRAFQVRAVGWVWIITGCTDTSHCTEQSTPRCSWERYFFTVRMCRWELLVLSSQWLF